MSRLAAEARIEEIKRAKEQLEKIAKNKPLSTSTIGEDENNGGEKINFYDLYEYVFNLYFHIIKKTYIILKLKLKI